MSSVSNTEARAVQCILLDCCRVEPRRWIIRLGKLEKGLVLVLGVNKVHALPSGVSHERYFNIRDLDACSGTTAHHDKFNMFLLSQAVALSSFLRDKFCRGLIAVHSVCSFPYKYHHFEGFITTHIPSILFYGKEISQLGEETVGLKLSRLAFFSRITQRWWKAACLCAVFVSVCVVGRCHLY